MNHKKRKEPAVGIEKRANEILAAKPTGPKKKDSKQTDAMRAGVKKERGAALSQAVKEMKGSSPMRQSKPPAPKKK